MAITVNPAANNNAYVNPADTPGLSPDAKANIEAQQAMQKQNMAEQMAYLALQNEQQKQNRAIETMSTMMKNSHDTGKAVIRNMAVS